MYRAMISRMPLSLAEQLRALMCERFGEQGAQRELAEATERAPGGGVTQATISRILTGRIRNPEPETLAAFAWALGGNARQRANALAVLRTAAGLTAQEPPPLSWPTGVDRLTDRQRKALQRVVNATVAAFLDEQ